MKPRTSGPLPEPSGLDPVENLWHLIGRSFDARHLAPWSWRDVAPSPWRVTVPTRGSTK